MLAYIPAPWILWVLAHHQKNLWPFGWCNGVARHTEDTFHQLCQEMMDKPPAVMIPEVASGYDQQFAMENITMPWIGQYHHKLYRNGPFSIAMLKYQRVYARPKDKPSTGLYKRRLLRTIRPSPGGFARFRYIKLSHSFFFQGAIDIYSRCEAPRWCLLVNKSPSNYSYKYHKP